MKKKKIIQGNKKKEKKEMKKKLFFGYHFPMKTYWENNKRGGFTQLSLDFTNLCNYKCDWCFNKKLLNTEDGSLLDIDARKKLIAQANELGAKTLVIPGTGEPTLDPYFKQTIGYAHSLGMITVIYSNLTGKLDADLIWWLYSHNVSIGIKFDSLHPAHFTRRYHTTTAMYEKFRDNLIEVLRVYEGSQVETKEDEAHRVIANMVLTRENITKVEILSYFCEKHNLPLFIRPVKPVDWAGENPVLWKKLGNRAGTLTPEQGLLNVANKYNTLFSPSSTTENHCAIYSFGLTVKSNGDVQLCPDHHNSKGMHNVRENGLDKIILSLNKARIIRSGYCVMSNL